MHFRHIVLGIYIFISLVQSRRAKRKSYRNGFSNDLGVQLAIHNQLSEIFRPYHHPEFKPNNLHSPRAQKGYTKGKPGFKPNNLHSPRTHQDYTKGCGKNNKRLKISPKIARGENADPKDWPWMAALLIYREFHPFCRGTLITDRHVLTAAHCFDELKKDDIFVRLGEYNFDTPDENSATDFKVDSIIKHYAYEKGTWKNDIAIIKLSRPTNFNQYIYPACLPLPNYRFEGRRGFVTGWGHTRFGARRGSRILKEIEIDVWKHKDCAASYPGRITNEMMCAGGKEGGKDSCQGDSGGPFVLQNKNSQWFVAGVVSFGKGCGLANFPTVHTRVNEYLDWIEQNKIY